MSQPDITTPTSDDVFSANTDTADEIVGEVVPDSMPDNEPGKAIGIVDGDELDTVPEIDFDAVDAFGRPLYDEDHDEMWYFGDQDWPYQFVEYRGDTLAVRKPTKQALSAFSLSASKHVKTTTQNNLTGLFIERHLSEATYDRVFMRMMDPDDPDYNTKSIGELIGKVVKLSTNKESGVSPDDAGDTED